MHPCKRNTDGKVAPCCGFMNATSVGVTKVMSRHCIRPGRQSTPPHPTPPKKEQKCPILASGVLTRQQCAEKWCASFWAPGSRNLVTGKCQIFNFHDFRHFWKVASLRKTFKMVFEPPNWSSDLPKSLRLPVRWPSPKMDFEK